MTKPTLKTIARLSGFAVPTVSRALGDAPDISKTTKAKIHKIAGEIGYVPNRAGLRLRTGRTNVISLVISSEDEIMNMTARLTASIAKGLIGTPYHLNLTHFFAGDDPMVPIRYIVETGSADAIIFNAVQPDDPRAAYLSAKGFPFVMHGRSKRSEQHAYFDYDNDAFAQLAVEKLVFKQRKNILMIQPPISQFYSQEMIRGAKAACSKHNIGLVLADGVTSDSSIEQVLEYTMSVLISNPKIDGIITAAPNAAMAATAGLERAGRTIGTDIDLVAKDAITFLKLFRDKMTIIHEDVARAGEFIAKSAVHAIRSPTEPRLRQLDKPTEMF